jgi:hypothetical protein
MYDRRKKLADMLQKFESLGSWSEVKGWFLSNKPPWCKAIKPLTNRRKPPKRARRAASRTP